MYTLIVVILLYIIPALYMSYEGTQSDPEGMIFQSILFPMACLLWSFVICKFLFGISWVYSGMVAFVSSMIISMMWRYGPINKTGSKFITNFVTYPLWFPMALSGKNKVTEIYTSVVFLPAMGLFYLFNMIFNVFSIFKRIT